MYTYNWLFVWQNNNLQGKYLTVLLFTAVYIMYVTTVYYVKYYVRYFSLYLGQITYKI